MIGFYSYVFLLQKIIINYKLNTNYYKMGRSTKQEHLKDVVSARDGNNEYIKFDFKIYKETIDAKYNLRTKL